MFASQKFFLTTYETKFVWDEKIVGFLDPQDFNILFNYLPNYELNFFYR